MVQGDEPMPERGIPPAGEPSVSHLAVMASRGQQQTNSSWLLRSVSPC